MLKNDTLKNGTSRIGLYGSAPPPSPEVHNQFASEKRSGEVQRAGFTVPCEMRKSHVVLTERNH